MLGFALLLGSWLSGRLLGEAMDEMMHDMVDGGWHWEVGWGGG